MCSSDLHERPFVQTYLQQLTSVDDSLASALLNQYPPKLTSGALLLTWATWANLSVKILPEHRRTHVYVLLSKLFVQALAQGTFCELARREDTGDNIAPPTSSSTREQQRPSLPQLVEGVFLECQDNLA